MSSAVFSTISEISAPAANARSEPVMTIAPTPLSASSATAAAVSSSANAEFSAFSASGRFRRISATRPSRVIWISSAMLPSLTGCGR